MLHSHLFFNLSRLVGLAVLTSFAVSGCSGGGNSGYTSTQGSTGTGTGAGTGTGTGAGTGTGTGAGTGTGTGAGTGAGTGTGTGAGTGAGTGTGTGGSITSYVFKSKFTLPDDGSPNIAPIGITLDSSGNIYITTSFRVMKFSPTGTLLLDFGGSGPGQVSGASSIAVDGSGDIFVVDSSNARVVKFDANGNYLSQLGTRGSGNSQFQAPTGIAIDTSGNILVADTYFPGGDGPSGPGNRVEKFGPGGNYLSQFGSGQFIGGQGIATDSSGYVYVTDSGRGGVAKFSSTGSLIGGIGAVGPQTGYTGVPRGVAVDAAGNIYVTDNDRNCVNKYSPGGVFLTQIGIGRAMGADGDLARPEGVALDKSGNVYVADYGDARVEVFSPSP